MALARSRINSESGFSLVEVLAATVILTVALMSLAQLFAISTRANFTARTNSFAALLAQQKMEQLRGLTWGYDILNLPVSDLTTDTSTGAVVNGCPAPGAGGGATGLSPSPWGSLQQNTAGWVDYLDQNGCLLGGGAAIPNGAIYIRRWSVEPLPTNPNNTLILQVLVTTVNRDRQMPAAGARRRAADEALVATLKTRKAK
jgi:prepilin-type N-terminal cleavage/methylation domain-containing protein